MATIKEIKEKLDDLGVVYKARAKKAELQELLDTANSVLDGRSSIIKGVEDTVEQIDDLVDRVEEKVEAKLGRDVPEWVIAVPVVGAILALLFYF